MIMEWIQAFQGPLSCRTYMTHTFYIDATGVNGRQLAKIASVFYGIHPQRHIVDQTNQCDAKSGYKTGARYSQNASVKGSGRVPKSVHSPVISSTKKRSDIGVACTTIYL